MVVQIVADRKIGDDVDTVLMQVARVADTREHEQPGEPSAPALRITSRAARTIPAGRPRLPFTTSTPVARPFSTTTREAVTPVSSRRFRGRSAR